MSALTKPVAKPGPATKAPAKPARTLTWTPTIDQFTPVAGVLAITQGKDTATYVVAEFPTGWAGRGFHFAKVGGGEGDRGYNVFCSQHGPEGDSCDCAGGTYHGKCKHRDAVRKLMEIGKL